MDVTHYYRADLALVHHRGFGFHADLCAPGILQLLEPIRTRGGLVLELGCGSGRLTRHLIDAGHRVIATDASPSMLALAGESVPEAGIRRLALPDDRIPEADAIVAVGHVLNYLPDEAAIGRAWIAIAQALRPGGVLAMDVCDLEWGTARRSAPPHAQVTDEWALITRFHAPSPARFVRDITSSFGSPTTAGGVTTSATRTCWSIGRRFLPCWRRTALRRPSGRHSGRKNCLRG